MNIAENIRFIQSEIAKTAIANHRKPASVHLLAVTKGQSVAAIQQAFAAGLTEMGENYFQEAQEKMAILKNLPLTWHFLGKIQSRKAASIARHFSWIHSLDRLDIAQLLNSHRPSDLPPLQVCLQINIDREPGKGGILIENLEPFIEAMPALSRLVFRGLMIIPKALKTREAQKISFAALADLLKQVNQQFSLNLDTLSMGMSDDFTTAIEAGATRIRIGRAIFGERLK